MQRNKNRLFQCLKQTDLYGPFSIFISVVVMHTTIKKIIHTHTDKIINNLRTFIHVCDIKF